MVPALLVTLWAQIKVQTTFKKYNQIGTRGGLSGAEASAAIQRQNGIHVPLEMVKGSLSDHYDPRANVIRLSETVYGVRSIAAVGVAAHETGHAMQYAQGYAPIQIRNAIVPVTRIASGVSIYMVLFGLLFWVYLIIPGLGRRDTYLFNMLPYLVTIAVLIFCLPAEQEGESAPRQPGSGVFPGRNGSFSPYKSRAPRLLAAALFSSVHFSAWWFRAAVRILRISMARVMGPTPPGTGVM